METKIIAIGNSKGVRLPKAALNECRLSEGETVNLDVRGRSIIIAPKRDPREGWEASFKRAAAGKVKENLCGELPIDEVWDR